jgi:hypothetical protein
MGVVGVKGPEALDDLSDGLRGKGIDDGLLCLRCRGVAEGVRDWDNGMFERDREPGGGDGTELGGEAVGREYGIGGAAG